jgi:hypothetical protein
MGLNALTRDQELLATTTGGSLSHGSSFQALL